MNLKNDIDPAEELPKVQNILYKLSHRFSQTYPVAFEDCLSESYYAFVKACEDYDPERGQKFTSWVYYWVWCKLKDMVMKGSAAPVHCEINEEICGSLEPDDRALSLMEDLSENAKEIMTLLFETPSEILEEGAIPLRSFMVKIKDWVVKNRGKKRQEVEDAHHEIKRRMEKGLCCDEWLVERVGLTPRQVKQLSN